jgi:glycolate oxidase FAD binding subunit
MAAWQDLSLELSARLRDASARRQPLCVVGGGSKGFYGNPVDAEPLPVAAHRGILDYDPAELVVTVRAGTPLGELEAALAERGQCLAFEPPRLSAESTIGGAIAAGLAGPARPWSGPVRDHVLGVRLATGDGRILSFGGRVMKNVAGYDVSRALAGSLGCLAVLLEVSLRTMPLPERRLALVREASLPESLALWTSLRRRAWPLSGACHHDGRLRLRLAGMARFVERAAAEIGGERGEDDAFWTALRDQQLPFFGTRLPLWRVSVPAAAAPLPLAGESLVDWAGAQRWLATEVAAADVRRAAGDAHGHATLYRSPDPAMPRFAPVSAPVMTICRRLKGAFDPARILSPGRLYPEL